MRGVPVLWTLTASWEVNEQLLCCVMSVVSRTDTSLKDPRGGLGSTEGKGAGGFA